MLRAGGAALLTTGGTTPVYCPSCPHAFLLGVWQDRDGGRAFIPHLANVRSIECGDGWIRLRCRRCDTKTTLDQAAGAT